MQENERTTDPFPHTLGLRLGFLEVFLPSDHWAQASLWETPQRRPVESSRASHPCQRRVEPPAPPPPPQGSRVRPCRRVSGPSGPTDTGDVVRPPSAGGGITETATVALLLTGAEDKTKSREIQPQPTLAKASYHRAARHGSRVSREEGGQAGVSELHAKASGVCMGRLRVRRTGCGDSSDTTRASPPAPAFTRAILGQ